MEKGLDFVRSVANDVLEKEVLPYALNKTTAILLELGIDDEKIIQLLVKHFDIRYSEAKSFLETMNNN